MNVNFAFNIPDLMINFTVVFQLALAVFIGSLIGRERKRNYKPGGSRTFAIICLGATLITVFSRQLYVDGYTFDFVRLLAYGLVSLGFATGGIVRTYRDKIQGLTTASTIWMTTIIGYCLGMEYYTLALGSTVLIYVILESKYKKLTKRRKKCTIDQN